MDRAGDEGRPHLNLADPRRRWRPLGLVALVVAAVTILDWPVPSLHDRMTNTLDGSWQMTMHLWGHSLPGLGPHVDFTYGPLGFLALPTLWFTTTGVLAWLAMLVVTAGCAYVAFARLRGWLPWWAAAIVALVVVRCITLLHDPAEAIPMFAFWWVAGARLPTLRRRMIAAGVLGLLAALLLLCKFGDGLILAGIAVLAPFVWDDRPWRELVVAVGALVAGLVVFWSLVTLAPGALPHYVSSSLALANGYWQMSLSSGSDGWALVAAPLIAVGLVALLATERGLVRKVALIVSAVWLGWLEFKHAFVRADGHHLATFFVAAAVVALAVGSRHWRWSVLRVVVVVAAVATAVSISSARDVFPRPIQPAHQFFAQATTLSSGADRARIQNNARAALRHRLAIPPEILAAIGHSTVQIDPYPTDAAWAYDLKLSPVPVFQLYSAYTSSLDDENAHALTGSRAPQFILRNQQSKPLAGRLPAWESPRYELAVLCNYKQSLEVGRWQLLEHTTPRCGAWQRMATVPMSGVVNVPQATPGSIVVATFDHGSSLVDKAKRTLYRELPPVIDVDGHPFRFMVETASAPHLLVVPSDAPNGPFGFEQLDIATLHLHGARAGDTVTFWSVPYTPES